MLAKPLRSQCRIRVSVEAVSSQRLAITSNYYQSTEPVAPCSWTGLLDTPPYFFLAATHFGDKLMKSDSIFQNLKEQITFQWFTIHGALCRLYSVFIFVYCGGSPLCSIRGSNQLRYRLEQRLFCCLMFAELLFLKWPLSLSPNFWPVVTNFSSHLRLYSFPQIMRLKYYGHVSTVVRR
jgi:hypothetical protein